MVSTLAGSGNTGFFNGTGTAASFNYPQGIAVDSAGNIYVADTSNNLIRKITPGGVVTTLAGSGANGSVNGPATLASFNYPTGLTVDPSGTVFVADGNNGLIRKITPGGIVSTLTGSNGPSNNSNASDSFQCPAGVALDTFGHIYESDLCDDLIKKIQIQ